MMSVIGPDRVQRPDFIMGQIPGGGQRGYASALLLEHFEHHTDLPTYQLIPHVTAGSVGILIASALYLPHPDHPNQPRMSARQMVQLFPSIAACLPKGPAYLRNNNNREPLAQALEPFIGHGTLKDLMATVFLSSHEIGGLSQSYKIHSKIINPQTGHAVFTGDPDAKIMDIALAGTSLPSVLPAHDGHIDLAFSEVPAAAMVEVHNLFDWDKQGMFIRLGNFRSEVDAARKHLIDGGYLMQTMKASVAGAVSDNSYAQTMATARSLFGENFVYNLEQEITADQKNAPVILATVTTPEQFAKIRNSTAAFIHTNASLFAQLGDTLGELAIARQVTQPDTAYGLREFPLPRLEIAMKAEDQTDDRAGYQIGYAVGRLTRGFAEVAPGLLLAGAKQGLQTAYDIAAFALRKNTTYDNFTEAKQSAINLLMPKFTPHPATPTISLPVPEAPNNE